jgi:hypothetical protein
MPFRSIRPPRPALAALVVATAAAVLAPVTAAATPGAGGEPSPRPEAAARHVPSSVPAAGVALRRAEALLDGPSTAAARTSGAGPVDGRGLTMVLRDLGARLSELTGDDRAAAEAILARPSQSPDPGGFSWGGTPDQSTCSATLPLCVHWTTSGQHKPNLTDVDVNGVPDWVDTTLAEMETVWQTEVVDLGYRPPLADTTSADNGGGTQLDVYLANIGGKGYYGYCTSDDPKLDQPSTPATSAVSAYCVLDNDYSKTEFPAMTPTKNLQVTAAHEFFHAVQFGYDYLEDRWLMESTAAWVEDVVYDDVNDNRQYLKSGPLRLPLAPLDKGKGGAQYGSWIFFRYLSEHYDNLVVRRIWEWADDSPTQKSANDLKTYSLPAISKVLRARGTTLRTQFADFVAANTTPRAFYTEGADYTPATPQVYTVRPGRPATPVLGKSLTHLSSLPTAVKPGRGTPTDARLRVVVDGPGRATGPEARVVVRFTDGSAVIRRIKLDRAGRGRLAVPFGKGSVASVVVVLVNASDRYRNCFSGSPFGGLSCWGGKPVDNGKPYLFQARLV